VCYWETNGEVTCFNCPADFGGRRCERCDEGYKGDPTVPGDSRRRGYFLVHWSELREIVIIRYYQIHDRQKHINVIINEKMQFNHNGYTY